MSPSLILIMMSLFLAILAGFVFPYSGFSLQRAFNNQLVDIYSTGLGSMTCLSASLACLFQLDMARLSLVIGFLFVLCTTALCQVLSVRQFLTFGLVVGSFIGSIGTIVCNNLDPNQLAEYYHWTGATYQAVTNPWITIALFLFGMCYCYKFHNRWQVYFGTGVMCVGLIYSVGIIWVISLVAPNIANLTKYNFRIKMLIAVMLGEVLSLTAWYITTSVESFYLPVSATMSVIAMPLYLLILTRSK